MPYLPEEVAIIDGMITAYFSAPGVSRDLRESYRSVHLHLQSGHLERSDYRRIRDAIDFLLPSLRSEPNDYRIMVSALVKTRSVLSAG